MFCESDQNPFLVETERKYMHCPLNFQHSRSSKPRQMCFGWFWLNVYLKTWGTTHLNQYMEKSHGFKLWEIYLILFQMQHFHCMLPYLDTCVYKYTAWFCTEELFPCANTPICSDFPKSTWLNNNKVNKCAHQQHLYLKCCSHFPFIFKILQPFFQLNRFTWVTGATTQF